MIQHDYSMDDLLDANEGLDLRDELERRAYEKARQQT